MANTSYVAPFVGAEIPAITSADTVRIRLFLSDAASPLAGKTGVAFDDDANPVYYCKPGEVAFTVFPTFDTNNWAEIGNGWYDIIIRGSDAGELALLDTQGPIIFDVKFTATNQAPLVRECKARLCDVHARLCYGRIADGGDGTIIVYDGYDPASANILFTLTKAADGDEDTYVRTDPA